MQSAIIPIEFLLDEATSSVPHAQRLLLEADVITAIQPETNLELAIFKRGRTDGQPPRVLKVTLDPRRDRCGELCALVRRLRGECLLSASARGAFFPA